MPDASTERPGGNAPPGLRYVSDTLPGITRRRRGKSFSYYMPDGSPVKDKDEIARIQKLAIPPAYRDVWICPHANGHLQATGIDAKGHKQYRYHARWRELRDEDKYQRVIAFGHALHGIREQLESHLALPGLARDKVLAAVVDLLQKTLIRVGNSEYARANASYGLTTLQHEHVDVRGMQIRFRFTGKSGKSWELSLKDRRIASVVKRCADIPGQELFKYLDDAGEVRDVTSADVNGYIKTIGEGEFTAKDFRTWAGTVHAALHLKASLPFETQAQAKKYIKEAIVQVASKLGNTPAICRKCYIHPHVLTAYGEGSLAQLDDIVVSSLHRSLSRLEEDELKVLQFLKLRLENA